MIKWRRYQKEVYETVIDNLDKYENFIIEAPTGFGKSIVNYGKYTEMRMQQKVFFMLRVHLRKINYI